jgi:hypothetical protein
MQILISSHINYYISTLPPLLESLKVSGVPDDNITIVVGGSPSASFDNNINFVTYNHFEYSSLRWIAEQRIKPEFVTLLHDTCTVLPDFWNNVKDISTLTRMIPLNNCNIGVYPISNILGDLSIIKTINNKQSAMLHDGFIFNRFPFCKSFGSTKIDGGLSNIYGTNTIRYKEIYPDMGIIKYRANNGKQSKPITIL